MLNNRQIRLALRSCLVAAHHGDVAELAECTETAVALSAELTRRASGPFTLAEAVASGRPFRRKVWHEKCCYKLVRNHNGGRVDSPIFESCDEQYPNEEVSREDILATDYELMPEGGER